MRVKAGGYLARATPPSLPGETTLFRRTPLARNVTALVQQMLDNGDLAFMLQAEELGSGMGRQSFHSSDASSTEDRPVLNITYRTTAGWSPASSLPTSPSTGSTL